MTTQKNPLLTSEECNFAFLTMTNRIPTIVGDVIESNIDILSDKQQASMRDLLLTFETKSPIPVLDTQQNDGESWQVALKPHIGKCWFEIPWFFAESYLYRLILEATGYFTTGNDPFGPSKRKELEKASTWDIVIGALEVSSSRVLTLDMRLRSLLHLDLWGNRADGCYKKVAGQVAGRISLELESGNILADDSEAVVQHLLHPNPSTTSAGSEDASNPPPTPPPPPPSPPAPLVSMILDNTGVELLLDLVLVDALLSPTIPTTSSGPTGTATSTPPSTSSPTSSSSSITTSSVVGRVELHVKQDPTFVSDATRVDVERTVALMAAGGASHLLLPWAPAPAPDAGATPASVITDPSAWDQICGLGQRLQSYLDAGVLSVLPHQFWNSSLFFSSLPSDLRALLRPAHLVVLKGDANYRRLVGDSREWPVCTPLRDAMPDFPAPFVTLRTLKSDPIVGLPCEVCTTNLKKHSSRGGGCCSSNSSSSAGVEARLELQDPMWRVNGRRGIIQAVL